MPNNQKKNTTPLSYKSAGVDIDAANQLTQKIGILAKTTNRSGTMSDIGGFGALFDLKQAGYRDPILCSATDGVGTKLRLAIACNQHRNIGIDLVAMCVNDLLVQNAEPLFFLDYFACGTLDLTQSEAVIASIAKGCRIANCALIGGETAEMPGMYGNNDYDLAGFAVGAVEREHIMGVLPENHGFYAIGLPSSGLHSNGYSLVHRILEINSPDLNALPPFDNGDQQTLAEILLTPTRIYVKPLQTLARASHNGKDNLLSGACHITGGGFYENLPRILPKDAHLTVAKDAIATPPIFNWLMREGNIAPHEMYRTFNMGIGMIIFTRHCNHALDCLRESGEQPVLLGEIVPWINSGINSGLPQTPQIRIANLDES